MILYKTEAIVLRDYDLGDQDKIVVFYSPKHGKIKVVAKGARRIKSRFAPLIQLLSYDILLIHKNRKKSLDTLNEGEIKYYFPQIKRDLVRFAYGCYLVESVDKFVGEREPHPGLFQLLLTTLFLLEKGPKYTLNLLMRSFELELLSILGYEPYLEGCVNCGKALELIESFYFSLKLGGFLCSSCQGVDKERIPISKKASLLMSELFFSSLKKVFQQKIDKSVEREIEMILRAYFFYQGQGKMFTPHFIYSFKRLECIRRDKEG